MFVLLYRSISAASSKARVVGICQLVDGRDVTRSTTTMDTVEEIFW